jgi:hypothetical protein
MEHAPQQPTTYIFNWVVGPDGKGSIVLTNSFLPVVPFNGVCPTFPCHDSHKPVKCSAQMIGTKRSGTEPFSLRLTSSMFDGKIVILVQFDSSFLDLFIGKETEVLFPLPIENPINYGMIMPDDMKGNIFLTYQSLPVVQMTVLVDDIPLQEIKYIGPIQSWWPKTSRTPSFVEKEEGSARHCTLPTGCLSVMPCHEGYVPVQCSGKIVWSQTFGSKTFVILLLLSKWLKTPIYVQVSTVPSFLAEFIRGENKVFFPMQIPKTTYNVEIKDSSNHKSLKGKSGPDKEEIKEEAAERRQRGVIGGSDDESLPVLHYRNVQKLNQVWSIFSNNWEIIQKPKPRKADWKWDDSTATWVCELDTTNRQNGLKLFNRSIFWNCFGGSRD